MVDCRVPFAQTHFHLGEKVCSLQTMIYKERCGHPGQKLADRIFTRCGTKDRFDTRSWFVPCSEEAKITEYVWHSNRHTFCSWLAMAGATIKEIQELAGHKTIAMSARYAHLSPDHKLSVLDRITGTATENANSHQPKAPTRQKRAKIA